MQGRMQLGSNPGWVAKGALIALVAATGIAGMRNALALALAPVSPETALRIAPNSPSALGQQALIQVQRDLTPRGRVAARALAIKAIRQDPTNVVALAAFGFAANDRTRERAAFTMVDRLSRRSLPTQLWLIEDAVSRNDVRGALRHYDIAMRVSYQAPGILFPVLVAATSDRDLLPDLAALLTRRPPWGNQYLQQLAQSGTALDNIALLFADLLRRGISPGPTALAVTVQRLVDARDYDSAWRLYLAMRPGQSRAGLRNGNFARQPGDPVVFDWRLNEDPDGVTTSIDRIDGVDRLTFSANSAQGGVGARQMLLLAPGAHTLTATASEVAQIGDLTPSLRLSCAVTGAELGKFPLPAGNDARGTWQVTVPGDCRAQWLELVVPPADNFDSKNGSLSAVAIR